jgi:hypothetical protein
MKQAFVANATKIMSEIVPTRTSLSAKAAAAPSPAKAAPALTINRTLKARLRKTGKPWATQSLIPPRSGTALMQPADRNMPVARLAWA